RGPCIEVDVSTISTQGTRGSGCSANSTAAKALSAETCSMAVGFADEGKGMRLLAARQRAGRGMCVVHYCQYAENRSLVQGNYSNTFGRVGAAILAPAGPVRASFAHSAGANSP